MTWCAKAGMLLLLSMAGCGREASRSAPGEAAFSHRCRAGRLAAVISLSRTNLTLSEQADLLLSIQVSGGPEPAVETPAELSESFVILNHHAQPPQSLQNGERLYRHAWVLSPSVTGEAVIPSLQIVSGGDRLMTDPVVIHVQSILPSGPEALEIRDIAGPVSRLPSQRTRIIRWLLLSGTALLSILLIPILRIARKRRKTVMPAPHEAALQALEDLPVGEVARLHELNHILREYIERRFELPMTRRTAREFMHVFVPAVFPDTASDLRDFFEHSEHARFSHAVPYGYAEEAVSFVRAFVEATGPGEAE